jgi:hypothetical protein
MTRSFEVTYTQMQLEVTANGTADPIRAAAVLNTAIGCCCMGLASHRAAELLLKLLLLLLLPLFLAIPKCVQV